MAVNWFKYASPASFYDLAGRMVPWFAGAAVATGLLGLYIGLLLAPTDFQQGDSYRIIYIHVPAAWMGMFVYLIMAGWAATGLIFNTRLSGMMVQALAPTGALFTFIALWTGALWGRPTWGTYWVWDARLTSTLILFFLYIGYIALHASIDESRRADRAGAVLVLVGVVNVPIIYFSVQWWNTLHQGASVKLGSSSMASVMLVGMLVMAIAAWMYTIAVALARVRSIIVEREQHSTWVGELLGEMDNSSRGRPAERAR
jgi:heme exporter protein C